MGWSVRLQDSDCSGTDSFLSGKGSVHSSGAFLFLSVGNTKSLFPSLSVRKKVVPLQPLALRATPRSKKREKRGPGKPGRPTPLLASGRARRAGGEKKKKKKEEKRGRKASRQRNSGEKEQMLISFASDRKKQVADRLKRSKTDGLSICEVRKRLFDTPNF